MNKELIKEKLSASAEAEKKADYYLLDGYEAKYFEWMSVAAEKAREALGIAKGGKDKQKRVECTVALAEKLLAALAVERQIFVELIHEYGHEAIKDPKVVLYEKYIDECKRVLEECIAICENSKTVRGWIRNKVMALDEELKRNIEEIERM